ncbi:MAG TPA: RiPP maturation radical SAM C-methyltransferase [Acidimicrobiales bacterium]|nr:RiPP maturation radical SAM C-methyltransferase [Acidimicrobiales bacterium]
MPFASMHRPSIGLAQLRAVVEARLGSRVAVSVLHLHVEYGARIGAWTYEQLADDHCFEVGLGDWLFRDLAHPGLEATDEVYLSRFFAKNAAAVQREILRIRGDLPRMSQELIDAYRLDTYDLIGFTSMFVQTNPSIAMARLIKERVPEVTTVMGGAACEGEAGQVICHRVPAIDFTFSGPALASFPRFLDHWLRDPSAIPAIEGLNQGRHVDLTGESEAGPPPRGTPPRETPLRETSTPVTLRSARVDLGRSTRGPDVPIDEAPDVDYNDYFDTVDRLFPSGSVITPRLSFETARGCWWGERVQCTFCGLNGESLDYTSMSASRAIRSIQSLLDRYASRCTMFCSVDNIMPKSYPTEVLPFLRPPPGVELFYEVKANITEDEVRTLEGAQVQSIQPGIEALSTDVLRLMRKGSNAFTNVRLLKNCRRYGVRPMWNLLLGFPGEKESVYQSYLALLPLLLHLQPPIGCYPVRFDRFSPYYQHPEEFGLALEPEDFYELTFPFRGPDLEAFAYYFKDVCPDSAYARHVSTWREPLLRAVNHWRARWEGSGPKPRLELVQGSDGGAPVVVDSRGASSQTYDVPEPATELLGVLEDPLGRDQITGHDAPYRHLAEVLDWALERQLVFVEGSRLMSLVLGPTSDGLQPGFDDRRPIPIALTQTN